MPQAPTQPRFGVSPAFVFSRHSTAFTVPDFVESVRAARELGFEAFQPEIYRPDAVAEWAGGGARQVATAARDHGLFPSQFVGHFLLTHFASADALASVDDNGDLRRALEAASAFEDCPVFTVPLAPYSPTPGEDFAMVWSLLVSKIRRYQSAVEEAGFTLALEVLNGSLVANTDGFLRLANELGDDRLGINLDTGHAWAARENLPLLPSKLGSRLVGLHLKDNDGNVNQPLAPGEGTLPWEPFLASLLRSGYAGSLDLEIGCEAGQVDRAYAGGLAFLKNLLNQPSSTNP